uniref:SSD domain-containing protein n=1 Tax=Panagrellus redivivus TaxID=6233 RepID=A0A7E4VBV9_PANRE
MKLLSRLSPDPESGETPFVKFLSAVFRRLAGSIVQYPWTYIVVSTIITLATVAKIPFTPMTNDVSDFTPIEARARKEQAAYVNFFGDRGTPTALFLLITAKNDGNMLGINELHDAVTAMDLVNDHFTVFNSKLNESITFSKFCRNFCTLNEPVRHFYNGLLVQSQYEENSTTSHIDLGYPITTVLGRQLRMDPNFFGVKLALQSYLAPDVTTTDKNGVITVAVNELHGRFGKSVLDDDTPQLSNNVREIKLVGLQFRAERPPEISATSMIAWEKNVVEYFKNNFTSNYVDVLVLSESHLTEEIVTAGLTLIPFLVVGFVIMVIFSSLTMSLAAIYMNQMHFSKFFLAVMACVCPFMACGTAMGLLFYMGFRFGTILCVTPFLVLSIGVDDAYLLVNSWQRIQKSKIKADNKSQNSTSTNPEGSNRMYAEILAEAFIDTAPSITITTMTNVLAFGIGAMTPTPEIQLFSIGNAVAIIVDYVFTFTVFGASMAIMGKLELNARLKHVKSVKTALEETDITKSKSFVERSRRKTKKCFNSLIRTYCKLLTNGFVSSFVMALLAAYLYVSIYGILNQKAELRPTELFLKDSDVVKIMHLRDEYLMPYYAVCMVFVNNPGNFSNPATVSRWKNLVEDFERLPSSLGQFSTKFWLRDYETFIRNAENGQQLSESAEFEMEMEEFDASDGQTDKKNELKQFLDWPEFRHWNGFIAFGNESDFKIEKFFFTTASYGTELRSWSSRANLLERWRRVADAYPDLGVTIFEDDAKFLDLIPTLIPQTVQSSIWTLICMFLVCLLVMTNPTSVIVASFAIISTCIGVFGILSLWGVPLDPIVMSCGIMSIGFSVDIPAHIAFHFYKSGHGKVGSSLTVSERIEHTLIAVGFPVIEASISTNICVLSMVFVDLHMAQVFIKTMTLVVSIGLVHGLLIIPVMLYLSSLLPSHAPSPPASIAPTVSTDSSKFSVTSTIPIIST